ncbi:MAG: GAF domain-containing protein [bacterium]|nr:GAF domain-containing protein [bacterium]
MTKRRDNRSPARDAEERFQALSRLVSDYGYAFQVMPDGTLRGEWVSESFTRVFGYTLDEIRAQGGWQTIVHPEDLPAVIEHTRRVASGQPDVVECRFLTRRGETRWLLDQAIPVWDPAQTRVVRIYGAARDITEHKQLVRSLQESEARYRHFFEHDLTGDYLTTVDGQILDCNEAFARLLGFQSVEDAMSVSAASLYPSTRGREAFLQKVRTERHISGLVTDLVRADGTQIVAVENVLGVFDDRGELVQIQGYMFDITDRVRAEESLRRRLEMEGIVAETSRALSNTTPTAFDDAISEALRRIGEYKQVDRSYLFLLSEDGSTMNNTHEWTAEGISPEIERLQGLPTAVFPWWMERLRRGDIIHVTRVADLPAEARAEREILEAQGIQSVLVVPLMARGRLAGYLGFDAVRTEKAWTDEGIRLLTMVAESIAAALERKLADDAQRRHLRETLLLNQVIAAASSALDPRDLLREVCRELALAFAVPAAAAALLSEDRTRLDVIAEETTDPQISVHGLSVPLGAAGFEGLFGANLTRPRVINDVMVNPSVVPIAEALQGRSISTLVVVPLVIHEEPVGVVALMTSRPRRFSEHELSLALRATAAVGQALDNARLHDQTRRRAEELSTLAAVSTVLRAAPGRAEMLHAVLDRVRDLLRADGASLALQDPLTGDTVHELGAGAWAAWTGDRLPQGEGISGHVIVTGEPYASADVRTDPLLANLAPFAGVHSAACVPLITDTQTIGALWAGRHAPFAGDEVRLLGAIGNMAATAIHRTTLREQTERQLHRLTTTRAIDRAITSSLDLRIILKLLVEEVAAVMQVDGAAVLLFRPAMMALEPAANSGVPFLANRTASIPVAVGPAGQAVLQRHAVSISDLNQAPARLARAMEQAGFVAYLVVPLIARGEVKGVLELFSRTTLSPMPDWPEFLDGLAAQAAIAIDNAEMFETLQRSHLELAFAYDATLEGWGRALDLRDRETEGHTRRVTELTLRLARDMRVPEAELVHVRRGSLLHDIGKMGVPDAILLKPGPLTDDEWEVMRRHPTLAREMLAPIPFLRPALDIPYCHHERWDGTGYPEGLAGEHIPTTARIFAVADVWDALRSDRPYRQAWSEEEALAYIRKQAGKHFDPEVARRFLDLPAEARRG